MSGEQKEALENQRGRIDMKKDEIVYRGAKKTRDMPCRGQGRSKGEGSRSWWEKMLLEGRTSPQRSQGRRNCRKVRVLCNNGDQTVGKHKKDWGSALELGTFGCTQVWATDYPGSLTIKWFSKVQPFFCPLWSWRFTLWEVTMVTSTGHCVEVAICAQREEHMPRIPPVPGNFSLSRCCSLPCSLKCELQTRPCPKVIETRFEMKNTQLSFFILFLTIKLLRQQEWDLCVHCKQFAYDIIHKSNYVLHKPKSQTTYICNSAPTEHESPSLQLYQDRKKNI